MVTMGPLAKKIGELTAELHAVKTKVADMESKSKGNRKRLRPEQVEEIHRMYWDGDYTQREIATEFGVNPGTVSRIVNGHYHKEIA